MSGVRRAGEHACFAGLSVRLATSEVGTQNVRGLGRALRIATQETSSLRRPVKGSRKLVCQISVVAETLGYPLMN